MPALTRSFREIRKLTLVVALFAAGGLSACAAGDAGPDDALGGETHYTLKRGDAKVHPKPLPTEVPILVDHFHGDGTNSTTEGFRGWDFNGDGRFEMVDVLNEDGSVQARLFDFDEDGRTDLTRRPPTETQAKGSR